ncbi:hypothetical protein HDU97_009548 [Phlyctochytrium planicorne]|nr:hypothetical protein HDU97_009548 [Phlyctochytrium planicorne]
MPVTIKTETREADAATPSTTKLTQPNCTLQFSREISSRILPGKGTLYVDEQTLIFHNPTTSTTVSIEYPTIVIHAISRGSSGPTNPEPPCIYCQLGSATIMDERSPEARKVVEVGNGNGARADAATNADDEDEEEETAELRIIPDDERALDAIYQALSECAALHPDPDFNEDDEDEEGGGDWIYSAEGASELSEVGQAALQHMERVFDVAPGATFTFQDPAQTNRAGEEEQFEDADDEPKDQSLGR